MITTCTECRARYRLDDDKIPHRVIKVRCPSCQGVFKLDGTVLDNQDAPLVVERSGYGLGTESRPAPASPPAPAPSVPLADPVPAPARQATAVLDEPAAAPGPAAAGGRRRKSKEEMYARALVSDILVYNREARDKALKDGNLVEALGPEIKKSWELYKEKVTAEVANSTDHFKQALNEILAEGRKIF